MNRVRMVDVGHDAAGIAMRLLRVVQKRHSDRDRECLHDIAGWIRTLSHGGTQISADSELFSTFDGLYCLIQVAGNLKGRATVREYLAELAAGLDKALDDGDAEPARHFFREVHDLAMELDTHGFHENPITGVLNKLA